jgi:general secretion pathway protein I
MSRRRARGYTLLEVLAAMSLFAIVATAAGGLATSSMRYTMRNRHATTAAMLAQQAIEDVRALDYPNIIGGTSTATIDNTVYTTTTVVVDNSPAANMKNITVTVSWSGPEGSRSYAIKTIYTAVTT